MTLKMTGSDLVEVAVQMERNGQKFYTTAADSVASQRTKALLMRLAQDEVEHLRFFEKLLGSVGLVDIHETYPGEYETYLQAYVDGQVFTKARLDGLLAQKTMSERDALMFGIDSEKDAILYYTEMLRFVAASDHQAIKGVIHEEKKHFAQLCGVLTDLKA
jgi:rubrerythrin